jgi:hypothetical protein
MGTTVRQNLMHDGKAQESMSHTCGALLMILLGMCTPALAQAQTSVPVRWEWLVVSTPDFLGSFRGDSPGFRSPVPRQSLPTMLRLTREVQHLGQFEVVVGKDGRVVTEKTLRVSGPEIEKRTTEALKRWRFRPALLEGKPIRVRLRVFVESGEPGLEPGR